MLWLTGPASASPQAPRSEAVSFHSGDVTLSGTLYLPVGTARHPGVAVFHAAGFGARDFHAHRHLTAALRASAEKRSRASCCGNSKRAMVRTGFPSQCGQPAPRPGSDQVVHRNGLRSAEGNLASSGPDRFFFGEKDAWVPVEESITNVRRASGTLSGVTIARIRQTDHFMETGPPDSGGPISEEYVARLLEWLDQTVTQRCRLTSGK